MQPGDTLRYAGYKLIFEAQADDGWTMFALTLDPEAVEAVRRLHEQGMFYLLENGFSGIVARVAALQESEKHPDGLRVKLELDTDPSPGIWPP